MQQDDNQKLYALLARIAMGDRQAFECLYQQTSAQLNGIAYRIVNDVAMANEILQDAYVQIWQHAAEYREDKGAVLTWMASIVRYRAYDRVRYEGRREGGVILEALHNVEQETEAKPFHVLCDLQRGLRTCLEQLESRQSDSIVMAYCQGYSRDELADYFAAPVNTVKSWLKRGLKSLQQCLNA